MGVFPEDYKIHVSKLIMLWVAEGLLKPIQHKSLEEVAEDYLDDLVKRNLVLITKKRSNGKSKFCSVHDLLRDLCIQKAQEEKFLDVYASGIDLASQRRLTIRSHIPFRHLTRICHALPIRSVLHFGIGFEIIHFILCLRLLRVLDTPKIDVDLLPSEITELFHLRYLAFAYYGFKGKLLMLPPKISRLRNLQTLVSHSMSSSTVHLSFKIWKISNLRHPILGGSSIQIPLVPTDGEHIPVLENLRTLSGVANIKLTKEALDMIPNLKKLKVQYTGVCEANCSKLCLNHLVHLHQIETLNLDFSDDPSLLDSRRALSSYPACYALPTKLKKLTLTRCRPPSDDMAIIGSLPNLEVLKLKKFHFVERYWESEEGEFPRLKFLLIEWSNLKCWRAESTHFPCLQHLIIRYCRILEEIPGAIGEITTLELIEIGPHSNSAADSAALIQEEQQSLGNDILKVRIKF